MSALRLFIRNGNRNLSSVVIVAKTPEKRIEKRVHNVQKVARYECLNYWHRYLHRVAEGHESRREAPRREGVWERSTPPQDEGTGVLLSEFFFNLRRNLVQSGLFQKCRYAVSDSTGAI